MATKKQKRAAGIAKREAFEEEERQRNQHFLQISRDQRRAERERAEQARKDRAIAKSKKLAKQHRREKAGVRTFKPAPKNLPKPQTEAS